MLRHKKVCLCIASGSEDIGTTWSLSGAGQSQGYHRKPLAPRQVYNHTGIEHYSDCLETAGVSSSRHQSAHTDLYGIVVADGSELVHVMVIPAHILDHLRVSIVVLEHWVDRIRQLVLTVDVPDADAIIVAA